MGYSFLRPVLLVACILAAVLSGASLALAQSSTTETVTVVPGESNSVTVPDYRNAEDIPAISGTKPAEIVVNYNGQKVFINAGAGAALGTYMFVIRLYGRQSGHHDIHITAHVVARPVITSVTPASGPTAGGTGVTIVGTGFTGVNGVRFGTDAGTSVSVVSDTMITVTTPPQSAGAKYVFLDKPDADGNLANAYTYMNSTTVALTASRSSLNYGESVTLSATLSNGGAPSGTVAFKDGVTTLAIVNVSGGMATLQTSALAVGSHSITAEYSGDAMHSPATSTPITVNVGQGTTTTTLSAENGTTAPGETARFTARVSPPSASGNVIFAINGVDEPAVALVGGSATLASNLLGVGSHTIVARYTGDATHGASVSNTLTQQVVVATGTVVIRQQAAGADGVFGFSSPTPELNFALSTQNGAAETSAIALVAGTYTVTADDMGGAGFALTGLACSNAGSSTNVATRTASIVLSAGESVICTFSSTNSRQATTDLIDGFLNARGRLLLANQPDDQRRIDRLNGQSMSAGNPISSLMGYLPRLSSGGPLEVSTSLAAIDSAVGNAQPNLFDVWMEGTFALFENSGPYGTFGVVTGGADYLITPDLLIGGFVQLDQFSQQSLVDPATITGTGWMAGPYATARLTDNLYLDVLGALGGSDNAISPYGTYEDKFGTSRWMISASLSGQWEWENWTFSPRVRASYLEETSAAYLDSLGVPIPSLTSGMGEIAIGPRISYRHVTGSDVVVDTGLRLDGVAAIVNTGSGLGGDNLHGRVEGTLDLSLPGGSSLGFAAGFDAIGALTQSASGKVRLRLPLN